MKVLEGEVQTILRRRDASKAPPDDLLAMILRETPPSHRSASRYLRDQILTFLFAGHDTTAAAASWVWAMLAAHPEVEDRLHEELRVLQGRSPTGADLPQLPYLGQVVLETLRLYPPVWNTLRETEQAETVGGYHIPAHATLSVMPYVVHRHPQFWPDPERFDPDRFAPELMQGRHPFAFLPFGGGPRQCIGRHTALLEVQLIVAALAQRFTLRFAPGAAPQLLPTLTLWPANRLPMLVCERQASNLPL